MSGQGPTYWSKASRVFEGSAWSFSSYRWPFSSLTTDNASPDYSMPCQMPSTLEESAIKWPTLRNHIPCRAHVIRLALGAFMSSLGVKGRTKYWEAHVCDQQFGETESIDIGKSQGLRKEGNARIDYVLAIRPGLAKTIEKVHISRYFESPETDHHTVRNTCCIDCTDTWLSKWVHWLSKSQIPHCSTTDNGGEDMLELDSRDAWASWQITRIPP